jgi:hypothetical protein
MSTSPPRTVLPPAEPRSATPGKTARERRLPEPAGNSDPGQLDLFDQPAGDMNAATGALQPAIDPAAVSDEDLLLGFARASLGSVEPLAREIFRRRPEGWTDAAAALWERFLGFGTNVPMPEQVAVLDLGRQTAAAPLLIQLLRRAPMADCLDPHLLPAAAACGVSLPQATVHRGLAHQQPNTRAAAVRVASVSRTPVDRLHPLLADPVRDVRRTAATVIAEAGDGMAREPLLREMRLQPDRRGLEALSSVANEDVVIRLGQIARQHHAWRRIIIEVLHMIDDPKAAIVAAGLEKDPG